MGPKGGKCFSTPFDGAFAWSLMRFGRVSQRPQRVINVFTERLRGRAWCVPPSPKGANWFCRTRVLCFFFFFFVPFARSLARSLARSWFSLNPLRTVGHRPKRAKLQRKAPSKGMKKTLAPIVSRVIQPSAKDTPCKTCPAPRKKLHQRVYKKKKNTASPLAHTGCLVD
jgi:hypothetical protein